MKKIYAILGLALCIGGAAIAAEEGMEPVQQSVASRQAPETGHELVAALRQEYTEGKFNSFLDGLEDDYQDLEKSGRLAEFASMRQAPEADSKLNDLARHYEALAPDLQQQRDSELKEICQGQDAEIACKRVQSATAETDQDQQEAMSYLADLRFKTPEQAANDDERKLVEIDLAYEFKLVHLDVQRLSGEDSDLQQKQIVLGMEKIEKMQDAAKGFSDQSLKKKIDLAAKGYDVRQSQIIDMRDLVAASKKPSSDLDRKIGAILSSYKSKKDNLYQNEFLAKLGSN